jgi:hypothetical protein
MMSPYEGAESNKQAEEMTFFWQQLNISWGLNTFRDKDGNWTENIQRVEEDILKVVFRYSVQEDERGGGGESDPV